MVLLDSTKCLRGRSYSSLNLKGYPTWGFDFSDWTRPHKVLHWSGFQTPLGPVESPLRLLSYDLCPTCPWKYGLLCPLTRKPPWTAFPLTLISVLCTVDSSQCTLSGAFEPHRLGRVPYGHEIHLSFWTKWLHQWVWPLQIDGMN